MPGRLLGNGEVKFQLPVAHILELAPGGNDNTARTAILRFFSSVRETKLMYASGSEVLVAGLFMEICVLAQSWPCAACMYATPPDGHFLAP